jgi:hypothetical protein
VRVPLPRPCNKHFLADNIKKMCGEIMPWQHTHEVVIRMVSPFSPAQTVQNGTGSTVVQPNPAHVRVDLGRQLEHVKEIRLTEYMVHNNGTPVANNLWFVSFAGSNMTEKQTCSVVGAGTPICIADMANPYHVVYDNPRTISIDSKRGINFLDVNVTTETGAAPTFFNITLYLTFVMNIPNWSLEMVKQDDKNKIEWWRSNENVGRFRF